MKPLADLIPMHMWVDVRDPDVIREVVALINDRITGAALEDEGTEIFMLSRHDVDAPAGLKPAAPGQRHFQIDMIAAKARLRFIVGVSGRSGSELIGYTPDELRAAAGSMHQVVGDLRREGRLTATSLARLQEGALMLEYPSDTPARWQPIEPADHVLVFVCATPERGE